MKRFLVSGDTFNIKDDLKKILPKKAYQKWEFRAEKKRWIITLQSAQVSRKFLDELNSFTEKNNLTLDIAEWDGFNREDNYK